VGVRVTSAVKMPTIANEKISFEVKFVQVELLGGIMELYIVWYKNVFRYVEK